MTHALKTIAARLPPRWQQELKRRYFRTQIRAGTFLTDEPEYALLPSLVSPGDCVLDVGANIGHYTLRLSQLVGEQGRVIALEPVPETFELLAANATLARDRNITLVNAAAADANETVRMTVPSSETGLADYYMARVSESGPLRVLCIAIDTLDLPTVRLAKIDTEGYELAVLRGMRALLDRDRPTLIVEDTNPAVVDYLQGLRYRADKLAGSSNLMFYPVPEDERILAGTHAGETNTAAGDRS